MSLEYLKPEFLIEVAGLAGIVVIVFAESGLFFGFFLPGDSLLFTAGLVASQGHFNIVALLVGTCIAAAAGDSVGYAFGRRVGPKIFTREDSFFFHRRHIERARRFYERWGRKTIVLARFVPIIRTFAPIVAGVGIMPYRTFLTFNVLGGFLWTFSMILLGFFLGAMIPSADTYVTPVVLLIVVISFIPIIREVRRARSISTRTP